MHQSDQRRECDAEEGGEVPLLWLFRRYAHRRGHCVLSKFTDHQRFLRERTPFREVHDLVFPFQMHGNGGLQGREASGTQCVVVGERSASGWESERRDDEAAESDGSVYAQLLQSLALRPRTPHVLAGRGLAGWSASFTHLGPRVVAGELRPAAALADAGSLPHRNDGDHEPSPSGRQR